MKLGLCIRSEQFGAGWLCFSYYNFHITTHIFIIQHQAHNRQLRRRVYKVFSLTN